MKMKTVVLMLLLTVLGAAAPNAPTYGPYVTNIRHTTVLMLLATDDTTVSVSVQIGTTTAYELGATTLTKGDTTYWVPTLWRRQISGGNSGLSASLEAGTTYYYKVVQTADDSSAYETTGSFTTLPSSDQIEYPNPPIPICGTGSDCTSATEITHAMPSGTYNADITMQPDCSDFASVKTTLLALTGSNNQRVVIPAGAECKGAGTTDGRYIWPKLSASYTGWVVVTSSAAVDNNGAAFPPVGVRAGPKWPHSSYARFYNNTTYDLGHMSVTSGTVLANGNTCPDYTQDYIYTILARPSLNYPDFIRCIPRLVNGQDNPAKFSAYIGATTITAMSAGSNATTDPLVATIPGHTLQVGYMVTVPATEYTAGGRAFISAVSGNDVTLYGQARKSGYAPIVGTYELVVWNNWRMPQPGTGVAQYTSGTGAPSGSCTEDSYYINTTNGQAYWCVDPTGYDNASAIGVWRIMYPYKGASFGDWSIVQTEAGASRYRFVGLELIAAPLPNPPPAGWWITGSGGHSRQGFYAGMVQLDGSKLVLDRCWIHAEGDDVAEPMIRINHFADFAGNDIALINNYFKGSLWGTALSNYSGGSGLVQGAGGHRTWIENNTLDADVTGYYIGPTGEKTNGDMTFRRNLVTRPPSQRNGSDAYMARFNGTAWINNRPFGFPPPLFATRNNWEWKQGNRALIEGNILENMWVSVTKAQHFALTQRMSSIGTAAIEWYFHKESITALGDGGVITTQALHSISAEDIVMVNGIGDTSWDGFHQVKAGCAPGTQCKDFTIDNIAAGTPPALPAGATVAVVATERSRLNDIDMSWNWLRRCGEVIGPLAYEALTTTSVVNLFGAHRWRIADNFIDTANDNGYRGGQGGYIISDVAPFVAGPGNQLGSMWILFNGHPMENVSFERNTIWNQKGNGSQELIHVSPTAQNMWGLRWKDELVQIKQSEGNAPVYTTARIIANWPSQYRGTDVGANGVCCGWKASQSGYDPSGTFKWPAAVADVGWVSANANPRIDGSDSSKDYLQNFQLRSDSRFGSGAMATPYCQSNPTECSVGSTGAGLGVDWGMLMSKIGRVQNARVWSITQTTATVSYLAPDSVSCTVEVSDSATWGTGSRYTDAGGDRVRNVSITGPLTANTLYYARVLCQVEQPELKFMTLP